MNVLVTGGAGFVAATLLSRLLERGATVVALDNLCRGSLANIRSLLETPRLRFVRVSLEDHASFRRAVAETGLSFDALWHLAANSDIPAGVADPRIDLRDTFLTTFNALRVARELGIARFSFASSSAIYGDLGEREITENVGPILPISNYGAMKLASEGQLSAAVESFLPQALLFRFPNVVGTPATHGVILDFVRKLKAKPDVLEVLGDGTQRKSYLHVRDLVDAMLYLAARHERGLDVFNIGPADDGIEVRDIAALVVQAVSPRARVHFGTGNKGWVGDVPRFRYSVARLAAAGWRPTLDSRAAVALAVTEVAAQEAAGA
ncbi:MAG: NAD-dependent epimerase/dehydratase family protein [Betaproteobacteria bacterium]